MEQEPITSIGNEDKLIVQKSTPLLSLWKSNVSLFEFKVLDIYLSRIDSHNPERRVVRFNKGEFERLLGVDKINKKDLFQRLEKIQSRQVDIPLNEIDEYGQDVCERINLFVSSTPRRDKSGLWQIDLECSEKAKDYIFNIEHLGYLRYKLRCITNIKSRYTYLLFLYLEQNRYRKTWEIDLENLKAMLSCDTEKAYTEYKNFNRLILKMARKELEEKTECKFSYEPIRAGRKVSRIKFTIDNKIVIEECEEPQEHGELSLVTLELWQEPIEMYGFSSEEYAELRTVLYAISEDKLPYVPSSPGNIEIMRYHYMDMKAKELNRRDKASPIRSKYNYLLKMIKQDMQ